MPPLCSSDILLIIVVSGPLFILVFFDDELICSFWLFSRPVDGRSKWYRQSQGCSDYLATPFFWWPLSSFSSIPFGTELFSYRQVAIIMESSAPPYQEKKNELRWYCMDYLGRHISHIDPSEPKFTMCSEGSQLIRCNSTSRSISQTILQQQK